MRPTLKAPGTKRLKLPYCELLLNFAFKFYLRRYIKGNTASGGDKNATLETGRGLHSLSSQLHLSALFGIGGCA